MGFAEVLTIVFVVLKLCGVIGWAWWQVLLPEIIAVCVCILAIIVYVIFCASLTRPFRPRKKRK